MKYFFRVVLTLILAGATVFGVYYYTNGMSFTSDDDKVVLTTVSKAPATEKHANKRKLASKGKYTLYIVDNKMLLTHGDKEFEFNQWSSYIEREKPKMYIYDIDGDGLKDVVVRGVSGEEQGTGAYVYDLYVLKRDAGKENYSVITATQDTWHSLLDDAIVEEITQLKTCKKYVQFAMAISGQNIKYDKKTGMVTKNAGYVGYARAMQDNKGKYMTVQSWSKGKGSYFVNENGKLCCEVEVLINYNENTAAQKTGMIYFEMGIDEEGSLSVTPGSLVFRADKQFAVADPKDTAKAPWTVTYKNSASPTAGEVLNWVKYSFPIDSSTITQTLDLGKENTDIAYVDSVVISEKQVVLTAKNNFTFDRNAAQKGDYSVTINKDKKGEYEISYTASVSEDGKTLTIVYDKTYSQEKIKTVDISYGSK